MLSWWVKDPRVPEFITRYEGAQRKSRQAGLAISDAWLVAVASHFHLAEKSSPDKKNKFEGLPQLDCTWDKWKYHLQDAQEALECIIQLSKPSADSFGSANSAANIHRILHNGYTVHPAAFRSRAQVPPTVAILAD